MYSEVTPEVFSAIVDASIAPVRVEEGELARKEFYNVLGTGWLAITNHTASVTQYYVKDINA